ncbi:hypothetical protein [Salipiger bermudensis]|uniref:hypothetical protein n=1 Tax=Salipiger bermudensis TaxID=344736 RepID=UPI001A90179B|nr:hypothetical protein [Salipiger bermudensis]MBN9674663.1 hypothetical protein [Salipiger bermudensis]
MTKKATVQYRYVNLDKLGEQFHLKNVVVDVLRRSAKGATGSRAQLVRHRKIDLDQDGSYVILNKMNDTALWDGPVFCGQLLHIRAGADVAGIMQSLEEDISELELRNITMGDDQRVVDGVLYFAIVHNHVGLIEGQRARSRTLERYLTRLLQDSGELEPGHPVILNAKLEGGSTVNEVSELFVSPQRSMSSDQVDTTSERGAGSAEGHGTTVFDVLETLGWSHEEIESLQAGLPEEGWIEGTFKMVFKQKAKKRAAKAAVARKQLEEALRNHHPASFGLRDPSGSTEKKGLARLAEKRDVHTVQDLLDPEDAMRVIVGLLRSWSTSGKIDCDFQS